jgi:putative ABC transport system permease protein
MPDTAAHPGTPGPAGAPAAAMLRAGFAALRGNPLRTVLSALGVVIGVGAMVSVLALSDGVQDALTDRLAQDGRLLTVRVAPRTGELVDGQWMPRADRVAFTAADAGALAARLTAAAPAGRPAATVNLTGSGAALVAARADSTVRPRGVLLRGALRPPPAWTRRGLLAGRWIAADDGAARVLVASHALAVRLLADGGAPADTSGAPEPRAAALVGREVWLPAAGATGAAGAAPSGAAWRVVGVLRPDENDSLARATARRLARGDTAGARRNRGMGGVRLAALVPVGGLAGAALVLPGAPAPAPELAVVASSVEALAPTRAAVEAWLDARLGAAWRERAEVASYENEGREAARAMLVFRLLMGAITGISLVVGGVGIMNVLLASVSERTREIGIAKAVGARARDVLRQYLAESVAIALAGALLGSALGLAVAHLVAAVMRSRADIPVRAGLSTSTVLVAVGAPIVVGLVFGLYPALRAARLSPIDAIRHE